MKDLRRFEDFIIAILGDNDASECAALLEASGGVARPFLLAEELPGTLDGSNEFANRILTADIDTVIFVTSVGVEAIVEQASRNVDQQRFLDCLADIHTVAGSKAAANALQQFQITPKISVNSSNSWRDILIAIDRSLPVINQTIALEESESIYSLISGLEARGARVVKVPLFADPSSEWAPVAIEFFEQLEAGEFHIILFPSPENAVRFCTLAKEYGRAKLTRHLLDNHLVLAIGRGTAEILSDRGFIVDYSTETTDPAKGIQEIKAQISQITKQKSIIRVSMSGPATNNSDPNAPWYNSPFMKACRGEPTDVTPIWMMRQAGRYMAEYREVRNKLSFLDLCANPQLCSEVMCTAVNRLGVDAAIIFSDLLPILVPMGCDLEFVKGDGPVIHNPVRTAADIDRIKPLESNDPLQFVMDTVKQTRNDLPADMPLIGFAGSPFTLASYMIEGGSSRNYAFTKTLMYGDHGAWDQLMQHLANSISLYLQGQIEAGAQCVQLFDSWAGCLSFEDYKTFAHPYVKRIIASLPSNVPVINFATGNPALLPLLADTRAAVIGIDWRTRLDDAWKIVGHDRAVQGNLDPTVLLTNPTEIKKHAKFVLDQAGGRAGHIFNLGHGILPQTPVDNAIALVDAVHELSQR
ncbi:MAG: uroporphyrinogen decarboxylase [Mariniblastus sp.]|nr:uroporphyrinogen decarboxylase [Mariniblastus sp.]